MDRQGRPPVLAGAPRFGERLERWAAEARVDEAARARLRERWLRHQADEEGTFGGVLADLADADASVQVRLRGGTTVAGSIRTVGADVVAVDSDSGGPIVISLDAVVSVRAAGDARPVVGDRVPRSPLCFDDVLSGLAAEREQVRVLTVDGSVLAGSFRAMGQDVLTLATDGRRGGSAPTYVPRGVVAGVAIDSPPQTV